MSRGRSPLAPAPGARDLGEQPPDDAFADVIIVAAGSSSRMGGIDKLAALVGGLPVLARAVTAIAAAPEVRRIVIVTSEERIAELAEAGWLPSAVLGVVGGGVRRQESVQRGFEYLLARTSSEDGAAAVILIHDGARPLVPTPLVSAVARAARAHGAAIPVLPVGDTIKRLKADGSVAGVADRSTLAAAQTPQGVRSDVLRRAFALFPPDGPEEFTDEAALLEACKLPVHGIPGDERNFKVTLPSDLARVQASLAGGFAGGAPVDAPGVTVGGRVGFGSDSHPFGPGTGLALGGIMIDRAPRLAGHSDGDVVLHAVADALLGAAGLGDLGRIFPAGPETPEGAASADLLTEVTRRVANAGFAVANLDCTIVAGRPRLAALLPSIAARIAALLDIDPALVNVKASSGNLDGLEGAGRGISASVVVVLGRRTADR